MSIFSFCNGQNPVCVVRRVGKFTSLLVYFKLHYQNLTVSNCCICSQKPLNPLNHKCFEPFWRRSTFLTMQIAVLDSTLGQSWGSKGHTYWHKFFVCSHFLLIKIWGYNGKKKERSFENLISQARREPLNNHFLHTTEVHTLISFMKHSGAYLYAEPWLWRTYKRERFCVHTDLSSSHWSLEGELTC